MNDKICTLPELDLKFTFFKVPLENLLLKIKNILLILRKKIKLGKCNTEKCLGRTKEKQVMDENIDEEGNRTR